MVKLSSFFFANFRRKERENELQDVKSLNSNYIDRSNSNNRKREYSFPENGLGSCQNVFLQENDRVELELLLNGQLNNYIERLSAYLKSSGKTYLTCSVANVLI